MVKKANHCAYDVHYHLVIVMKYRKKILVKEEYIDYLCQLINELAERWEFDIEEIGSDGDHIHLLLSALPRYSPSRIMNVIKGTTGRLMFRKFPELRKQLWGGALWSGGGYVGTVGKYGGLEGVIKYIKKQGSMNKKQSVLTNF
ncbi:MAG: IS200/IS605 family transposase [Candidatus Aenigmarchaeota archaeon]|nr:IS200/IS605 family transposase [Candidatus Aenigmarchaeota archaeon]